MTDEPESPHGDDNGGMSQQQGLVSGGEGGGSTSPSSSSQQPPPPPLLFLLLLLRGPLLHLHLTVAADAPAAARSCAPQQVALSPKERTTTSSSSQLQNNQIHPQSYSHQPAHPNNQINNQLNQLLPKENSDTGEEETSSAPLKSLSGNS